MKRETLLLTLGLSLAAPSFLLAQVGEGEQLEELEAYQITGSRIQRLDVEPVAPILTHTREDIEAAGFTTIGDTLRSMSFTSGQALTPTDAGTSFTPGISTVNFRGLGNNQVLVLINGRRAAPYASTGFDGLQTMFDLNSIPTAAIERIDVELDGASALYGSDAVGGVINVILRSDYEGLRTTATVGDYFHAKGFYKQASAVIGTRDAKSSIIAVVDWEERNPVEASELRYSRNADKTNIAAKADARWTVENWEHYFGSLDEYLEAAAPYIGPADPIAGGWFDQSSSFGFPGAVNVGGWRTFNSPTNNPTTADAVPGYNFYNFQESSGLFSGYERLSFYTQGRYDFTDNLYGFVELSFTRIKSMSASAATPVTTTENGLVSGEPMVFPGILEREYLDENDELQTETMQHPYNPWGVDISSSGLRRRMVEAGPRISDVTSDTPRVVAGLGGNFELLTDSPWNWEAYVLHSENSVSNISRNAISDSNLQKALYGLTDVGGKLVWDDSTPLAERTYFNWFGINSPEMMDFLLITNPNYADYELSMFEASVSGTLFDLPAGAVGVAFGAEYRSEEIEKVVTQLNSEGMIIGGSTGDPFSGGRDVTAVYSELAIPVLPILDLQLAARYEDYSDDGFESEVRPKIGFALRPLDWLLVKGSYSESFKAPDLAYMFNPGLVTFTSQQIFDPVTQEQINQLQVRTSGDPNLGPETADTYYLGVHFEPTGSLEGFYGAVEWFLIERDNLLAQLTDLYSYSDFIIGDFEGDPTFAGRVVRDPGTQEILYLLDSYANLQKSEVESLDFSLGYRKEIAELGEIHLSARSSYMRRYEIDGDDVSEYLVPQWRHTISARWRRGDWSANLYTYIIGSRVRHQHLGYIFGDPDSDVPVDDVYLSYTVDRQVRTNVSVSYEGFFDTKITVGVNNIFNSDPPADPYDATGSTAGVNQLEPSFWFVRLEREF